MTESDDTFPAPLSSTNLHRAAIRLAILITIAVAAFSGTLALAKQVRARNLRDAREWFRRGDSAAAAGRIGEATAAYRHAVAQDRGNREYVLALASALTRADQPEAAERAVLALRESAPDDPAINQQLARLAARRGDVEAAIRYYRNAIYAPWPSPEGHRRVRDELVELLLAHGDRRALPEVLAATNDLPDTVDAHLRIGRWFAQTGDFRRALDQYMRAAELDRTSAAALQGAGIAAFQLGDYRQAVDYLRQAPVSGPGSRELEVATLVLSHDPLAPRLGSAERRRRLLDAMSRVHDGLQTCAPESPILGQLDAASRQLPRRPDVDDVSDGVELLARAEAAMRNRCPTPERPVDEALAIIARRQQGGTP